MTAQAAIDRLLDRPDVPPRVAAAVAVLAILGPAPRITTEGKPDAIEQQQVEALRGAAYHAIVDWLTAFKKDRGTNHDGKA